MGFIHKHRCGGCHRVWEHERLDTSLMPEAEGDQAYAAAHACPFCGTGPWYGAHFDTPADEQAWDAFVETERKKTGAPDPLDALLLALMLLGAASRKGKD